MIQTENISLSEMLSGSESLLKIAEKLYPINGNCLTIT